jgi:hypothetical protein
MLACPARGDLRASLPVLFVGESTESPLIMRRLSFGLGTVGLLSLPANWGDSMSGRFPGGTSSHVP